MHLVMEEGWKEMRSFSMLGLYSESSLQWISTVDARVFPYFLIYLMIARVFSLFLKPMHSPDMNIHVVIARMFSFFLMPASGECDVMSRAINVTHMNRNLTRPSSCCEESVVVEYE